jgi:lysophospholipase L1-like esterase
MNASTEPIPRWKLLLFAVLPTLALFGALEISLRVAGFQYSNTPLEVRRFTDDPQGVVDRELAWQNRDGVDRFEKDAQQLWVPKTSPLERHDLKAAAGVFRIAALGDSCTAYCVSTRDSFPELAERFLNERLSSGQRSNKRGWRRVEVLNAGVASYSSFQGLQRLKHAVLPYQPDLITVFFGWNDHWITGTPDDEIVLRSEWETSLVNALDHLRIYQAGRWLLARARAGRSGGATRQSSKPVPRVSLENYDANLRQFASIARAEGIQVLFITAPQDLRNWDNPDLQPLSTAELVLLHGRYNDIVRAVAAETGMRLLDLDAIFEQQKPRRLIAKDGIHFNPAGCRLTADSVAAAIATHYLDN